MNDSVLNDPNALSELQDSSSPLESDAPTPEFEQASTLKQFSESYQVSMPTIHRWIKHKKLGSVKIGHLRRVTPEHDRDFLKRHNCPGT